MENDDDIEKLESFLTKLNKSESNASCPRHDLPNNVVEYYNTTKSINNSSEEQELQHLQKCVRDNQNCYMLLNKIESYVYLLLEDCIKEQRLVKSSIDTLMRKKCEGKSLSVTGNELFMRKRFRMPYFKDGSGFSHVSNEDVFKRRIQGFVSQCDVLVPRPWSEREKNVVISWIRKVEEEKWTQTLKACGMLKMVNIKDMSLAELVEERYDEYDWLAISASDPKNMHSPHECRVMWFTSLHPQINQNTWTQEENVALGNLVTQFKGQDWESIVEELGTKRSALQCIKHFMTQSNKVNKCEWTENEIRFLKKYVEIFRFGQFIPWHKITLFIDGRNSSEIFRVWKKINEKGKPRTFSLEEDIVLVAGMRLYGNEYARIKEYLPDRSAHQVCRRVEVLKGRQFPTQPWSSEEDKLLKDLVKKYGYGNWLKISLHFVNRSPPSIRQRFATLQRYMEKYGSNESCASIMLRNPRRSTDIVNLELLWETAQNIYKQNHVCTNISEVVEKNSTVNFVNALSQLLKPEMRHCRSIDVGKLQPLSRRGYFNFFRGAYVQSENKFRKTFRNKEIIVSSTHYALLTLKLLKAKIILPPTEEIERDKTISEIDKCVLQYLVDEISVSEVGLCTDDLLLTHTEQQMPNSLNDSTVSKCNNFVFLFPPNTSTLIALRSVLLNHQNLKEQKDGLTMQVDNIEWKHMNTCCPPQGPSYSENHNVASKLWNERIYMLLGCVIVMLNKESENYNSALNVFVQ